MSIIKLVDKDLIKYCKENEFPVPEMTYEDFKSVEGSLRYGLYKLKKVMCDLLEHRKKSCKNFKIK